MAIATDLLQRDTRANQPLATDVGPGTLYCVTDEGNIVEQSDGAAWNAYSPDAPGGATGSAGGDLTGTYPNPTIASGAVTYAKMQDVSATDKLLGRSTSGAGDVEEIACTAAGRALLDDADAAAQRTTLGLGTAAVAATGDFDASGDAAAAETSANSYTDAAIAAITENDVGASTNDAGNTSTAITIDWSVARVQKITATDDATVTHSNMVAGIVYTLEYHTGAGGFTGDFASTDFGAAGDPTLTVTPSKFDMLTFTKAIGGTIHGAVFGQGFTP